MATKKGLGRGLDALLDDLNEQEAQSGGALEVGIYAIDTNPDQPRKTFDQEKLEELAASIKRHGVVQPLLVRKNRDRYTIIAGERRFRAARLAGRSTVPVLVSDMDDATIMEVSLVENIQRENLNPIEEAAAIRLLMEQHDLTQEEVSTRIGKSRPAIANALRLLSLEKPVAELVKTGTLSAGHGKMLAGIEDADEQEKLASRCAKEGWSVRRLEDELRFAAMAKKPKKQPSDPSPAYKAALKELRATLGTKVTFVGSEEKGKLVIHYYSKDDLDRIYRCIVGEE